MITRDEFNSLFQGNNLTKKLFAKIFLTIGIFLGITTFVLYLIAKNYI